METAALATRDERIRDAELRVIARDEALRKRFAHSRARLAQAVRPRRWVWPAALAAGALGGLAWAAMRGRRRHAAAVPQAGAPRRTSRSAGWVRGIGLVWPLLPAQWRAKVSPGTAAALAAIGLPLLERVAAEPKHPPLSTAAPVDLGRWMGTWYEVARLPAPFEGACRGQPSASYALQGGTVRVENRCRAANGREEVSVGEARIVPSGGNAQLEVSLWPRWLRVLPMAWADYWIVHVDDDYRAAVVGHPSRRFCWLLSRTPHLGAEARARLVGIAAAQGFDVQRLRFVQP